MTRLILVRHGETDWNQQHRFQGWSDIPLNEMGERQASAVAACLQETHIDRIISSPLQRALQTAVAIADLHDLPVESLSCLKEMNFGDWEGMTFTDLEKQYPDILRLWQDNQDNPPPNGERISQFGERVGQLWDVVQPQEDHTVLVVAHGGTIQALLCQALGLPVEKFWQFRLKNTAVSELILYDSGCIINKLNDTYHLTF